MPIMTKWILLMSCPGHRQQAWSAKERKEKRNPDCCSLAWLMPHDNLRYVSFTWKAAAHLPALNCDLGADLSGPMRCQASKTGTTAYSPTSLVVLARKWFGLIAMIGTVTAMGAAALRDWRWILAISSPCSCFVTFVHKVVVCVVGAARPNQQAALAELMLFTYLLRSRLARIKSHRGKKS